MNIETSLILKSVLAKKNHTSTKLNLSNLNINGVLDFSGIKNVSCIDCSNNQITELINLPIGLIELNCSHNQITKYTNLPIGLKKFNVSHNKLTGKLNLNNYTNLVELNCSNNLLRKLKVNSKHMIELNCSYNQISKLIINNNCLEILDCSYNKLTEQLNISLNTRLFCSDGNLSKIDYDFYNDTKLYEYVFNH